MSGPRFSIIPADAVTDPSIELRDLQVLTLLGKHTNENGWCTRSQVKMAVELRCGRATVQRSLDRLYVRGYVQRRQEGDKRREAPREGEQPFRAHSYRVLLDRDDQALSRGKTLPTVERLRGVPALDGPGGVPALDGHGGVPTIEGHGVPAIEGHGVPAYARAHERPNLTTPSNALGERTRNSQSNGRGERPLNAPPVNSNYSAPEELNSIEPKTVPRTGDAPEPVSSAQFAEFMAAWPTAASDDQAKALHAWGGLSLEERQAALKGIQDFLAKLKADKRDHVPASWKYLSEKRWALVKSNANDIVQFNLYSRDWWGATFAKLERGERCAWWINFANQAGNKTCCAKAAEMPSIAQLGMLMDFLSDGPELQSWRPWFEQRGARLPQWSGCFRVYLPSVAPPSGKRSVWKRHDVVTKTSNAAAEAHETFARPA